MRSPPACRHPRRNRMVQLARRVMIATPCLTGQIDAYYVHALVETVKLACARDIMLAPIFIPNNSLIQTARNDLIAMAYEAKVDDMVWIDGDVSWQPEWFFRLLDYPADVVGGTYRRKQQEESYVCTAKPWMLVRDDLGLMQVEAIGTGFLRMSNKAIAWLWDNSEPYRQGQDGPERRWVFDVRPNDDGELMSEDVSVCFKLREGGFSINCDPDMTCDHIGPMKYKGNFAPWAEFLHEQLKAAS
jgi:hypothetical protein